VWRKPPALPEGGVIAVVAPSSPTLNRSEIEQGLAYFRARGYEVVEGRSVRRVHGYLAGTDAERAADLEWALTEPGIDMVLALCGGYGAARLHGLVDWGRLGEPRIVCGFSDITAIHLALAAHASWTSFYGPGLLRFTRRKDVLSEPTEEWFHRAFQPAALGRVFEDPDDPYVARIGSGVVEAPIVGGNLTLVSHSIGTPFEIQTEGCVLMLEEVDADPYMVDACLNHLRQAGKLDGIAGFVFGTPVNLLDQVLATEPYGSLSAEQILDELIAPLGVPAIGNVPLGHGSHLATLPLGVKVRLDADAGTLDILEAAVTA
jgi:muramoyltetrapeptide carboxypeptidase